MKYASATTLLVVLAVLATFVPSNAWRSYDVDEDDVVGLSPIRDEDENYMNALLCARNCKSSDFMCNFKCGMGGRRRLRVGRILNHNRFRWPRLRRPRFGHYHRRLGDNDDVEDETGRRLGFWSKVKKGLKKVRKGYRKIKPIYDKVRRVYDAYRNRNEQPQYDEDGFGSPYGWDQEEDDVGGSRFTVGGGIHGGGRNGRPSWNVNSGYTRTWDEEDDALGY